MNKLIITFLVLVFSLSAAVAQRKLTKEERAKLTPEQRLNHDTARKKDGGRTAGMAKKVKREKKTDRKARKIKSHKGRRMPKPK